MDADREDELMPIALLLDFLAITELRRCCEKGFINRDKHKRLGVYLLEGLGLIENVKSHKFLYRYEPTELGKEVVELLPSDGWIDSYVYEHSGMVYGDGLLRPYESIPRYRNGLAMRKAIADFRGVGIHHIKY